MNYKTLLGLANVDADVIEAEMISVVDLKAENADINNAIINKLTIPNGTDSYILTSDKNSLASWKPNDHYGDITGPASATVQNHKWIGNWDPTTEYKRFNRVTHNHIEYRASEDNNGVDPENSGNIWNIVLSARPDTVYEDKVQAITNKTNVETLEATISDKFSYKAGAGENKVLTCIDETGSSEWRDLKVDMFGDVTGQSNNNVVHTLGNGTIDVTKIITESRLPSLLSSFIAAIPPLIGDVTGPLGSTEVWRLGKGTINVSDLVRKTTVETLTNKTINHSSNNVAANTLRSTLWSVETGGGVPVAGDVLFYNGVSAQWSTPVAPVTTLAGDVSGPSNKNVVTKASGNFTAAGTITTNNQLAASNGDRVKKIVVHEEGVPHDSNDHRFHGLGVSPYQMRYQVASTVNDHIFHAAVSPYASKALFTIGGNGITSAHGRMQCRSLLANTWEGIGSGSGGNGQGAYMAWNRSGGSGRTTFANQQGGGVGGWEWVNYDVNGNLAPAGDPPAMQLSREGNLYLRGDLNVSGTVNINAQYVQLNGTWSGGWSQAGSIHVWRIGKTVTLGFTQQTASSVNNQEDVRFSALLPTWARPSTLIHPPGTRAYVAPMHMILHNATQQVQGYVAVTGPTGQVAAKPYNGWYLMSGWNPSSISYPCD